MKDFKQVTNPTHIWAQIRAREWSLTKAAKAVGISQTAMARAVSAPVPVAFATAAKLKNVFGDEAVVTREYVTIKCKAKVTDGREAIDDLLDEKEREGYRFVSVTYWAGAEEAEVTFEKPAEV